MLLLKSKIAKVVLLKKRARLKIICNALLCEPVSPVGFCNVLQHCLGQNAKYAKSQKGAIFLLARKAKTKTAKKERWARFRQKAKIAKKAKMANHACNGRDKRSVKYGPMCYAICEV